MPDFLLEIGLEEVPARMIASAQAELQRRTVALLEREHLLADGDTATSYSTPRRLAVLVNEVRQQQENITEDITGPAVKIAFKDGAPTPAAEAFARKSGVDVTDLRTISTPKGDYLAATSIKKGRTASEVLAAELPKEIAAIYWAKNMYWRPRKPERFVRPICWLACLLGDAIVPLTFAGKTAGRTTYGHRVLSSGAFDITSPTAYLSQLESAYVLADVELRRQKIRKALDRVTRTIPNTRWREDEALVDAVTHLTEWPDVLLGNFEPAYLALPEEVLVTVMRDHQKYFAIEDANGKLTPHFLTVTNIALNAENASIIRQGNERVLRARFNDARFFWEFDQRTPLAVRVKLLENVTFQKDLGSYAQKTERVWEICGALAKPVQDQFQTKGLTLDFDALKQATFLAKTDLTTELVKEFTELQGVIGGLYAEAQGLSQKVRDVIKDQYLPASAIDRMPRSYEGAILGLADRIDTIAGMFALGMEPTGSKDPFALRRAANAIVRILAESGLPLRLSDVINAVTSNLEVAEKLRAFFYGRIDFYLRESHLFAYDVVKAVMTAGADDLPDTIARAQAVTSMRGSEDFLAVSAAFKRMKNILAQANFVLPFVDTLQLDEGEEKNTPEHALKSKYFEVNSRMSELIRWRDYLGSLEVIATLRPQIDEFFEKVMINDSDPKVRLRRLRLLAWIQVGFSSIADFSEIVTAG